MFAKVLPLFKLSFSLYLNGRVSASFYNLFFGAVNWWGECQYSIDSFARNIVQIYYFKQR